MYYLTENNKIWEVKEQSLDRNKFLTSPIRLKILKTMAKEYAIVLTYNQLIKMQTSLAWSANNVGRRVFLTDLFCKACIKEGGYTLKIEQILVSKKWLNSQKDRIFEHVVPKFKYIQNELESIAENLVLNGNMQINDIINALEFQAFDILKKYWILCRITSEEDKMLRNLGYSRKMPDNWNKNDPFARYDDAGIEILSLSNVHLKTT